VKEIDVYSLSAVSDDTAPKGRISNPYTCHEFDSMMNNGTWEGGYVEEYGYMDKGATIMGTSEDTEGSYSWEAPWRSLPSDPWTSVFDDGSDYIGRQTGGGDRSTGYHYFNPAMGNTEKGTSSDNRFTRDGNLWKDYTDCTGKAQNYTLSSIRTNK